MMAANAPRLARHRRLLERQWPWFLLGALAAGSAILVVLAVDGGFLAEYDGFPAILRGYTLTGVLFGVGALVACGLSFAYALRKRSLQERLPFGKATLATWLWSHVYLGLLALVLALGHAGWGAFGFEPSSGKLLFACLALIVGSGLLWRLLYVVVPPAAARTVGNYSEASSQARAQACQVEIEKIAAGSSARFRELTAWVVSRTPSHEELSQALGSLPPEERAAFQELSGLARSRIEALARERRQRRYLRLLQGLRIVHVPLGLLFFVALPLHVVLAYDLPAKFLEPKAAFGTTFGGFEPASRCGTCHGEIYAAWKTSMHAHAMTSPIMIAQTNQVAARVLAGKGMPDPGEVCVACHGPIGSLLTDANTLPLPADALSDRELLDEGVSCAVCHQWQGQSHPGAAGLSAFQQGLLPGRTVYGPRHDAVGNAFHRSEPSALSRPSELCQNCHSVELDKNGDGKIERGSDLVLQTLYEEWELYSRSGGAECVDCHMPVVVKAGRSASSAVIPLEQDKEAPPRSLRDHAFVGVDYPLDHPGVRDATKSKRDALLASAATLAVVPGSLAKKPGTLSFTVSVTNSGTGHNLPGGFAFVRQMWLETVVFAENGSVLSSSGVVANPADDLCDASVLDDPESPVRPFASGCATSDPSLVSFQQMLVDKIQIVRDASGAAKAGIRGENLLERAPGAKEAVIQELTGGPVPRVRPSTGKPTTPLTPGETGTYPYVLAVPAGAAPRRLEVRLLFRVAAPYFLRALGQGQAPGERVRLATLPGALEVTEMAKVTLSL
jgi:hypothetical protein